MLSEAALAEWVDQARADWPDLRVDDASFGEYLRQRLEPDVEPPDQPLRDHLGDLYLAWACAVGSSRAIEAFQRRYARDLAAVFDRPQRRGVDAVDLLQSLYLHLLVGHDGKAPRIAEYRGRGSLRTWLRVVALRQRLNAERGQAGKEEPLASQAEARLADAWDVEHEHLGAHYREAFRVAFHEVMAQLDPRDRGILRLHVVHGLSATGIAAAFGVHRATAKRWLATVRSDLLEATRRQMLGALRVEASTLDSIMELLASRLDVSIRRCLEPDAGAVES